MVKIFPIIQMRRRFTSKCNVDNMIICKNFLNKDKSTEVSPFKLSFETGYKFGLNNIQSWWCREYLDSSSVTICRCSDPGLQSG